MGKYVDKNVSIIGTVHSVSIVMFLIETIAEDGLSFFIIDFFRFI